MRAFTSVLAVTGLTAAVLCVGPDRVLATQSFQQAVKVTAPSNAGSNPDASLNSLACTSVGNCVGVGSYTDSSGNTQAMAATETNGAWGQAVEVTAPADAASNPSATLKGISCTSAGNCEAVGSYDHTSDEAQAMAVAETNGTWAQAVKVSLPAGGEAGNFAGLYGVSCTSSGDCEAVGSYNNISAPPTTLAMAATETSGTWGQAVAVTAPAGAYGSPPQSALDGLSCISAGDCQAVGTYPTSSNNDLAMEATETDGTWSQAVEVSSPADADTPPYVVLSHLSCTSAGNCQAVGWYTDSSGDTQAMEATETGGTWSQATKVTAPADAATNPSAILRGISCTSAGNCGAVGSYTDSSGDTQAMAASENATPTITSFTPTSGPIGTKVTIRGTNLSDATKVTFNGSVATTSSDTATKIVVHVPTGATTGKIKVKTPGGTAKSATKFTVT